jgi:hypothetical protein
LEFRTTIIDSLALDMSFGFSPSDIALLVRLAWKAVDNSRKACGAHDELSRELTTLHIVLQCLERESSNPQSLLCQTDDDRQKELEAILSGCEPTLNILDRILTKYNSLPEEKRRVTRMWKKFEFGNGEMQDLSKLRVQLATHTNAITLFLNLLSLGSQGKVEQHMSSSCAELRELRKSLNWIMASMQSSEKEGSSWTSHTGDDKEFWRTLRRELIQGGFPSNVIRKHRAVIRDYVMEIGSRGGFDEMDQSSSNYGGSEFRNSLVSKEDQSSPPQGSHAGKTTEDPAPNGDESDSMPIRGNILVDELFDQSKIVATSNIPEVSDVSPSISEAEKTKGAEMTEEAPAPFSSDVKPCQQCPEDLPSDLDYAKSSPDNSFILHPAWEFQRSRKPASPRPKAVRVDEMRFSGWSKWSTVFENTHEFFNLDSWDPRLSQILVCEMVFDPVSFCAWIHCNGIAYDQMLRTTNNSGWDEQIRGPLSIAGKLRDTVHVLERLKYFEIIVLQFFQDAERLANYQTDRPYQCQSNVSWMKQLYKGFSNLVLRTEYLMQSVRQVRRHEAGLPPFPSGPEEASMKESMFMQYIFQKGIQQPINLKGLRKLKTEWRFGMHRRSSIDFICALFGDSTCRLMTDCLMENMVAWRESFVSVWDHIVPPYDTLMLEWQVIIILYRKRFQIGGLYPVQDRKTKMVLGHSMRLVQSLLDQEPAGRPRHDWEVRVDIAIRQTARDLVSECKASRLSPYLGI